MRCSWVGFPVLVIYSDSIRTHAGAKAPRNTHLRALNVSTWQLSLNAADTIHVLATTFLRSVFLWIEKKSSFHMPAAALSVLPGFQKHHWGDVRSTSLPSAPDSHPAPAMCSSCWLWAETLRCWCGLGPAASCCEDRVLNQMWRGPWCCVPIILARGSQVQLQPGLRGDALQCSSPARHPQFSKNWVRRWIMTNLKWTHNYRNIYLPTLLKRDRRK